MTKKEIVPLYADHLSQRRFEEAFELLAPEATMWVSSSQQTAPVPPALKEAMRRVFQGALGTVVPLVPKLLSGTNGTNVPPHVPY